MSAIYAYSLESQRKWVRAQKVIGLSHITQRFSEAPFKCRIIIGNIIVILRESQPFYFYVLYFCYKKYIQIYIKWRIYNRFKNVRSVLEGLSFLFQFLIKLNFCFLCILRAGVYNIKQFMQQKNVRTSFHLCRQLRGLWRRTGDSFVTFPLVFHLYSTV